MLQCTVAVKQSLVQTDDIVCFLLCRVRFLSEVHAGNLTEDFLFEVAVLTPVDFVDVQVKQAL